MSHSIVIDCPFCDVRVKAEAKHYVVDPSSDDADTIAYFFVECPSCKNALLGVCRQVYDNYHNWYWDKAERLWPNPRNVQLSSSIPQSIRTDIQDAQKCLRHRVLSAAVVLCGRAIERVVQDKTSEKMIAKGLRALRDAKIIDDKLFQWAEVLRKERNIGAHATEDEITRENAEDLLDFTIAICDYIYTLNDKFESFMKRKEGPTT